MSNYRYQLDLWAILLFAIAMVPNVIWGLFSGPDDVLHVDSITPIVDIVGLISQVLMLVSLMLLRRKDRPQTMARIWEISTISMLIFYLCVWISHFFGYTPKSFIVAMAILPCLFFGAFSIGRRNWLSLSFCLIFSICHILFAIENYILNR